MMKIIKKPLINDIFNYDVILFGMGINHSMNNGFAREIKVNFPEVYKQELGTKYGDLKKYGTINIVKQDNLTFCTCYYYYGGYSRHKSKDQVDYDSLLKCLKEVEHWFKGKKIAAPILGVSDYDGNGDREKILKMFEEVFKTVDITLYDYIQDDYDKHYFKQILELRKQYKDKVINKISYQDKRSNIEWERLYGIFKKRPNGWFYKPTAKNKQLIKIKKHNG